MSLISTLFSGKIILNCFVLPFRPKRSAEAYGRIWDGKGFPLVDLTKDLTKEIEKRIGNEDLFVKNAFLLSSPRAHELVDDWEQMASKFKKTDEGRWLFIPMFPQFSESTTMAAIDALGKELGNRVNMPSFEFVSNFHRAKCFIDHSVRFIENDLQRLKDEGKPADDLIISFHGLPKRRVIEKNDIYYQHCFETFELIKQRVKGINSENIHQCFQSRFGNDEWLTPDTEEYAVDLAKNGSKSIAVYCPSFLIDCLETVDEIGTELKEEVEEHGAHAHQVLCLNTDPGWVDGFSHFLKTHVDEGLRGRAELFYHLEESDYDHMVPQTYENPPLNKESKSTLGIVFLTLFLDLVGFSIIFPLFPSLAKHYLEVDGGNYWLNLILTLSPT